MSQKLWVSGSIATFCLLELFSNLPILAQSIIAAPDGTGTIVQYNGNTYEITGGTQGGTNLFHSFQELGLSPNEIANFLSNPSIQNILGRVIGGNPSIFEGLIQLTGGNSNLYLMNPAGIIFGAGATLDVPGSFTATTADAIGFEGDWFHSVGTNDYQTLVGSPNSFVFANPNAGTVLNAGNLRVNFGQNISLIGGTAINTGTISAFGGKITITAVPGQNLVRINPEGAILGLEVAPEHIHGGISAVDLPRLLTNPNLRDATGVRVDADGTVRLTGSNVTIPSESGTAVVSGTVDASNSIEGVGGNIDVFGNRIGILNTTLNAFGESGGGRIRVGGDLQGNGMVPNAEITVVGEGVRMNADAIARGHGGTIIIWADNTTQFHGTTTARGGANSGNGGFVEVSGKQILNFQGNVDTAASNGNGGTLLLDPTDINVVVTGGNATLADVSLFANPNTDGASSNINANLLNSATTNIILQASNTITFSVPVNIATAGVGLAAQANNGIAINADITTHNGAVRLNGDADNSGEGAIALNNATITTGTGATILIGRGDNGNASRDGETGITLNNSTLTTTTGNISLNGTGGTGGVGKNQLDGTTGDKNNLGGIAGQNGGNGSNGGAGISLINSTLNSTSGMVNLIGIGGNGGAGGRGGGGNGGGSNTNSSIPTGGEGGIAGGSGGNGVGGNATNPGGGGVGGNFGGGNGGGGIGGTGGGGGNTKRAGGGGGGGGTGGTGGGGSTNSTPPGLGNPGNTGGAGGGGGATATNGGGGGGANGFGGGGGGSNAGANGGNGGNGAGNGGNGGTTNGDGGDGGTGSGQGGLGTGGGVNGQNGIETGNGGNGGVAGGNNGGGGGGSGGDGGNGGNGGAGISFISGSISTLPGNLILNGTGGNGGNGGNGGGGGGGGRGVGGGGGGSGGLGGLGGNGGGGIEQQAGFQLLTQQPATPTTSVVTPTQLPVSVKLTVPSQPVLMLVAPPESETIPQPQSLPASVPEGMLVCRSRVLSFPNRAFPAIVRHLFSGSQQFSLCRLQGLEED
ncbi:filamentous hemagglutinin N-terminal domain-containing protein [Lusitaniella coriacea LEGE 07157]|uniref:Filamentous hemagglutinin N-terminal domain-containing protein n=1 Tax=Lusitaniella coriacea LEGE 07157 TaxID=945747 RepID=A0A8J7DX36_9CYAN|nr:filamentous hemagglutinin N-terminal domain-containing protein [Lusitaniella coriacea]MBE9116708.1 filamentous hemagglutinin N-terminal domain-containing protein [Lusitaniella coriacea LEGE 07157]